MTRSLEPHAHAAQEAKPVKVKNDTVTGYLALQCE